MVEKPIVLPIKRIITESPRVKTFYFDYRFNANPGQFLMVWVPGVGERPIAVFEDKKGFSISVAKAGTTTSALHEASIGQKIGFRGPFGTYFTMPAKKGELVLVGGGYGISPLAFLAIRAKKNGRKVVVLNGARNKEEVLFQKYFQKLKIKMLASTDDGSQGKKGFVHQLFMEYLQKQPKPAMVYLCGPELMEYAVAKICWQRKIPFQVSLERYMKCGIGVCGSCCVDKTGWRMCVEGPVLDSDKLKKISEFGKYHRAASGKIEKF
ncbi:MAG: dihydroorotate dehydrogenase electron transfer subunit [Patescibacteria group bacterium]|nr:dihydroorotate dehydrogenase electron transfer subunit [Patescibacteria group bacterium]